MKHVVGLIILTFILSACHMEHPADATTNAAVSTTVSSIPETSAASWAPQDTASAAVDTISDETAATVNSVPDETTAKDPIQEMIDGMTNEEKVGQMILARCPDINAQESIQQYHLGGYILFDRDFGNQTPESFTETINRYQQEAAIPLFVAVDEEGGPVCRVSSHKTFRSERFPSPRNLYALGKMEAVLKIESEKAALLHDLGINVNMAPVCDICSDPNAFMFNRSLGESPEVVSQFVSETVFIMNQNLVGSVLKHFPGYGNNRDTHTGIAVDGRSITELEAGDLIPFSSGIQANCGAILVSHTIVNCLDSSLPASLSSDVHTYLRNRMGFQGVIITDDLMMDAIQKQYDGGQAAVMAVIAGNDLLCSSEYVSDYTAVLAAVQDKTISQTQINQSVYRILTWKANLGLI